MLPPFLSIFAIYVGLWTAISALLAILLEDTDLPIARCAAQAEANGEDPDECGRVNDGFDDFSSAFYSMMIASTNAEVPGQQIPAYTEYRAIGALWFFSYFSVNFVMLSLILAVVYNAYAEALKTSVIDSFRYRALGLRAAYQVMRPHRTVPLCPCAPQTLIPALLLTSTPEPQPFYSADPDPIPPGDDGQVPARDVDAPGGPPGQSAGGAS